MTFRLNLDPINGTAEIFDLTVDDVLGAASQGDIAALMGHIDLLTQRLEEVEMALQNATNNAGRIEYVSVTGTTQALTNNSGFIAQNASAQIVMTLPTTAPVGSVIDVVGVAAGGWRIAQNAAQMIHFGNKVSTTGATGSLSSTNAKDTVRLLCVTQDVAWTVLRAIGNLDIV